MMGTEETQELVELILMAAGVALIVAVGWFAMRLASKRRRQANMGMTPDELRALEKKQLLSPEEQKKVREAMARQYLETEKLQRENAALRGGVGALSVEAQKMEERLRQQRARVAGQQQAPTPHAPRDEPPSGSPAPRPTVPEAPPEPRRTDPARELPEHLQQFADRPRQELDDLLNAGFLEPQDYDRLLAARGERP